MAPRASKRGRPCTHRDGGVDRQTPGDDPCAGAAVLWLEGALRARVLAWVLAAAEASPGGIAWLCGLMLVSRHWRGAVLAVLADVSWRRPFVRAGVLCDASMLQLGDGRAGLDVCRQTYAAALLEDAQCGALAQLHLRVTHGHFTTFKALTDVAKRVSAALQAHPGARAVQRAGRVVFAGMARFGGDFASCALQEQGAVPLMVQALDRFGASPAAVHALMDFMGRGYIRIHLYDDALVDAGALPALAGAMQRHPEHLAFQVAGLACFLALAELHPRKVVEAGAHARAWACMRVFAGCAEAQEAALALLCKLEHAHLTIRHGNCLDGVDYFAAPSAGLELVVGGALAAGRAARGAALEAVMRILGRARARAWPRGLVPLVLKVMEDARDDAGGGALSAACSALSALAAHPASRREVVRARVQAQVCEAMRRSPLHWEVQRDGCRVLAEVSYPLGARQPGLALPGAIALVVAAVRRNMLPRNRWWQSPGLCAGIAALAAFMRSRRNIGAVSDAGAVDVLLPALEGHSDHMEVAGEACLALTLLATHDRNCAVLQDRGAVRLALRVFAHRLSPARARAHALGLLASLVAGHPHTHAAFRAQQGGYYLRGGLCELDPASAEVAQGLLEACSA